MTPSGDPLRRAFASPLRRSFGNPLRRVFNDPSGDPLRRAFENFLKPPQESHHFKFLLDLFKFMVHRKAEWRSGLRRRNCERMRVRMKVERGRGFEPQSRQYCSGIVKLIKTNNLERSFDFRNRL